MSWIYWVYVYFYTQISLQRNQHSDISEEIIFYFSTTWTLQLSYLFLNSVPLILYKPHHCQILLDPSIRWENIQFKSGDRCSLGLKGRKLSNFTELSSSQPRMSLTRNQSGKRMPMDLSLPFLWSFYCQVLIRMIKFCF